MSSDGNHMTHLRGLKQEIQDLEAGFEFSVSETKCSILIVNLMRLMINWKILRKIVTKSVHGIVTESISIVKDSVIEVIQFFQALNEIWKPWSSVIWITKSFK